MNLLHVTPAYYPATYWGGPIFSVYQLNNALTRLPDIQLKVLATDSAGPGIANRIDISSIDHSLYKNQEVLFTRRVAMASIAPGLLGRLPSLIRWADMVHLTSTYSFPVLPTLLLCSFFGKPLVWSLRGALLDDQNRSSFDPQSTFKHIIKTCWLGVCHKCIPPERVAIHVTTVQEQESAYSTFPDARFAVIPNGVEASASLPRRNLWMPGRTLRLLYLGRLAPKKGIENLLQAVAKVKTSVRLDVYGSATRGQGGIGYDEKLVDLARDLGVLDKQVYFHRHVDGDEKDKAFLAADVCVVPSYSENFCIVVAEALAAGLPVIVSDRLAWSDVEKRNCGLVVKNDPESLAEAIRAIRKLELDVMGKRGWQWMLEEFGWPVIAGKMKRIYVEVLRGMQNGV